MYKNLIECFVKEIAVLSIDGRCLFCLYQPQVPKKLKMNILKDKNK